METDKGFSSIKLVTCGNHNPEKQFLLAEEREQYMYNKSSRQLDFVYKKRSVIIKYSFCRYIIALNDERPL